MQAPAPLTIDLDLGESSPPPVLHFNTNPPETGTVAPPVAVPLPTMEATQALASIEPAQQFTPAAQAASTSAAVPAATVAAGTVDSPPPKLAKPREPGPPRREPPPLWKEEVPKTAPNGSGARPMGIYAGLAALLVALGGLAFWALKPGADPATNVAVAPAESAGPTTGSPPAPPTIEPPAPAPAPPPAPAHAPPLVEPAPAAPVAPATPAPNLTPAAAKAADPAAVPSPVAKNKPAPPQKSTQSPNAAQKPRTTTPAQTPSTPPSEPVVQPVAPEPAAQTRALAPAPSVPTDPLGKLRAELRNCDGKENVFSRTACTVRIRHRLCGDLWGKVPECPQASNNNELSN